MIAMTERPLKMTPHRITVLSFPHRHNAEHNRGSLPRSIPVGQVLRIELAAPAKIGWTSDHWRTIHEALTICQGNGWHIAELDTSTLPGQTEVEFTMYWLNSQSWEGIDYRLEIRAVA